MGGNMKIAIVLSATLSLLVASDLSYAQAPEQGGLEEIIVTAQRREETLQNAALAVSAISGQRLVDESVSQATDLTRLVPSIQVAPASSFTQIYLRGVGTFGANAWAEQGVAFNLDGVYLSRPAAPAGLFYDLERIEVLKGPQGTLYGRNASGGALNVITAKPDFEGLGGYFNAEVGDNNAFKTSAALNAPLSEQFAMRLSGQYVERDGFLSDGYDDEETWALRGQLGFDNQSNTSITLSADFANVGGAGSGGSIMPLLSTSEYIGPSDPRTIAEYLTRPPTPPVPQIIAQDDGYQDNDFFGAIAEANIDLGFAMLTVIPAYRKTDLDFVGYAASFLVDVVEVSEQTSIEARLGGETELTTWTAGLYYFDESTEANQFFDQASNATLIISDLATESFAAFGQLTYALTDQFRLVAGLRSTRDNKVQDSYLESRPFVGFVPPGPPDFIPIILTIPTVAITDVDFDEVTWKAGIEYDAAEDSLLYASVSTGFKSGILFGGSGQNYSEPELLTAYTIGSKNRFLDNRLQLNLEAFYWDYEDQQISHLGPTQVASTPGGPIFGPVFLTENAGQATILGLEVDLVAQVSDHGLLSVNLQYLDTEYDDFQYLAYSTSGPAPVINCDVTPTTLVGATPIAAIYAVDCSGKPLVNAPEWSTNISYDHAFDLSGGSRIDLHLGTLLESSRYLSIDFLELGEQDSYMMSNARLSYTPASERYTVAAFANNLEDERVFSNSLQSPVKPGTIYNQNRPPRTYGLRLMVNF